MTPDMMALQRRCENLVRENETLTRDNAELRGQLQAIKRAAIMNVFLCRMCKHINIPYENEICSKCLENTSDTGWVNWQPPEPPDA